MQIHELTKKPRRTDEGILDSIKNAVGLGDKDVDKAQDKYWNKNQAEINKSAKQSAAALSRKGFKVNPHNLPLSAADTPKNIAAGTAGTRGRNDTAFQIQVNKKRLKSEFDRDFVGPMPPPIPESTDSNMLNEVKDIQRDFPEWIDSRIPGLEKVKQDPAAKPNLDNAFNSLVAVKDNPTALSTAFDNYVQLATNYISKLKKSNENPQAINSQPDNQFPDSTTLQQGEQTIHMLSQFGITNEIAKKVYQGLRDRTINKDSLMYAIQKVGRGY
jgi:hypothetical protein